MDPKILVLKVLRGQGSWFLSCVATWTLFCGSTVAQSKINPDADPWVLEYGSEAGPNGPWNAVTQLIDFPEQNVTFFPSLTQTSLFVPASACDTQDSACQLQRTGMWSQSPAHSLSNWVNVSIPEASRWDVAADPLALEGAGTLTTDRIVLWSANRADGPYYLDGIAISIASNYTVTDSVDTSYTLDVGILSLHTGLDAINWTTGNGSDVSYDRFLNRAYQTGNIPSVSFGLHVGSVWPPIPGSLVLGGYDRSRCISTPIVSDTNDFSLAELSLEVTSGGWPFLNATELDSDHLLRNNGASTNNNDALTVMPNPGVPYMYLPKDTCSTIATFLPVAFDQSLGHYIWNTTKPAFKEIMSSPSALKFSFLSTPTQYFPCVPYTPSEGSAYHLGRAFLQAAFLGQHGQAQKTFLAQAPGPGAKAEALTKLGSTDTTLTAMANPPYWNATWSDQLEALPTNNGSGKTITKKSGGISGGAIAGIVVGVVAGLGLCAIAGFVLHRRRKSSSKQQTVHWGGHENKQGKEDVLGVAGTVSESASEAIHEIAASEQARKNGDKMRPAEMAVPEYVGELEGSDVYRRSHMSNHAGQSG